MAKTIHRRVLMTLPVLCAAGCTTTAGVGDRSFLEKSRQVLGRGATTWQDTHADRWTHQAIPLVGDWTIDAETFTATVGDADRAIMIAPVPGNAVRVRFQARLTSEHERGWIGDITVLVGALADKKKFWTSGYALTTGSYWNNCTTFYRLGKAIARTEWSPLRPGVWHTIEVEVANGVLRYWVDGQIVLEARDNDPLPIGDADRSIGLRTWATRMEVRGFEMSSIKDR